MAKPHGWNGPSDRQAAKSGTAARRGAATTSGGVDANASKAHLMEIARQLDVESRSKMTKADLIEAVDKSNRRESTRSRGR
jgi:hypothetical protein